MSLFTQTRSTALIHHKTFFSLQIHHGLIAKHIYQDGVNMIQSKVFSFGGATALLQFSWHFFGL